MDDTETLNQCPCTTKKEFSPLDIISMPLVSIPTLIERFRFSFEEARSVFNSFVEQGYIDKDSFIVDVDKIRHDADLKKQVRIIFLDIDGVLNCSSTADRCSGYVGIEDKKVALLKTIVAKSQARIVLTSSWKRYWYKDKKEEQDKMADYLDRKMARSALTISDKTTDKNALTRSVGIKEYINELEAKGLKVVSYVILDDELFDYREEGLMDHLIKTKYEGCDGGLNDVTAKEAIRMLES